MKKLINKITTLKLNQPKFFHGIGMFFLGVLFARYPTYSIESVSLYLFFWIVSIESSRIKEEKK